MSATLRVSHTALYRLKRVLPRTPSRSATATLSTGSRPSRGQLTPDFSANARIHCEIRLRAVTGMPLTLSRGIRRGRVGAPL